MPIRIAGYFRGIFFTILTLVPVRCIRIRTNIDMRDVRISGFKYNAQDLESTIRVPARNQLIVDT